MRSIQYSLQNLVYGVPFWTKLNNSDHGCCQHGVPKMRITILQVSELKLSSAIFAILDKTEGL